MKTVIVGNGRFVIVHELYYGRDDIILPVQLRSGKSFIQRLIQHLYSLELNRDTKREKEK